MNSCLKMFGIMVLACLAMFGCILAIAMGLFILRGTGIFLRPAIAITPLLILFGLIVAIALMLRGRPSPHRTSSRSANSNDEETLLIQDLHQGFEKLEKRIESLETILIDKVRRKRLVALTWFLLLIVVAVILLGLIFGAIVIVTALVKKSGASSSQNEDLKMVQEMHRVAKSIEERLEAVETIVADNATSDEDQEN